jgi:hypothetical protein
LQGRRRTAAKPHIDRDRRSLGECDVLDEQAGHALALTVGRRRLVPEPGQVGRERHDASALRLVEDHPVAAALPLGLLLGLGHRAEPSVPVRLELVSDQAVVRVDLHEPAAGQVGLVARPFHVAVPEVLGLVEARLKLLLHGEGRFQRHGGHGLNEQLADGLVDVLAGEALADRLRPLDPVPLTRIHRHGLPVTGVVAHGHALPAHAADRQAL